jgi:hypothetical protein
VQFDNAGTLPKTKLEAGRKSKQADLHGAIQSPERLRSVLKCATLSDDIPTREQGLIVATLKALQHAAKVPSKAAQPTAPLATVTANPIAQGSNPKLPAAGSGVAPAHPHDGLRDELKRLGARRAEFCQLLSITEQQLDESLSCLLMVA